MPKTKTNNNYSKHFNCKAIHVSYKLKLAKIVTVFYVVFSFNQSIRVVTFYCLYCFSVSLFPYLSIDSLSLSILKNKIFIRTFGTPNETTWSIFFLTYGFLGKKGARSLFLKDFWKILIFSLSSFRNKLQILMPFSGLAPLKLIFF